MPLSKRLVRAMDRFKARARELRKQDTSAEAKLWQALRNRNIGSRKFRRQEEIEGYIVDFICPAAKLVIEVDGATHSTDQEIARDAYRTRVLEACGLHVIRFTNDEVYRTRDRAARFSGAISLRVGAPSGRCHRWRRIQRPMVGAGTPCFSLIATIERVVVSTSWRTFAFVSALQHRFRAMADSIKVATAKGRGT